MTELGGHLGLAPAGRRDTTDPTLAPPPGSITFGESHRARSIPRWLLLLGLVAGSAYFARLMSQVPRLGLVEFALMGILSLYAVVTRRMELGLCILVFIPGAEIVWRQAQAPVPYLAGPYLATLLCLGLTFFGLGTVNKSGRVALLYFLLLLPACIVTLATATLSAREAISFALTGPMTLAAAVVLCSQLQIRTWFYRRLLWIMVISGIGSLAIALTAINDYIVNTGKLNFSDKSNFITSGGFGPVQVSSLMGLTALLAILLCLVEDELVPRILAGLLAVLATVQSFLTFSRGGMFATAFALAGLALSQTRSKETRRRVLVAVLIVFAVGYAFVVPWVDNFTGNKFQERFKDTHTGRSTLAANDVDVFLHHLPWGVGPGMSKYQRLGYDVCTLRSDACSAEGSSHTEFTRVLSEHGLTGVITIVLILVLCSHAVRAAGPSLPITITFLVWAVAQMFYANMRVVAIPLTFALAFVRIREQPPPETPETDRTAELLATRA